MTFRDALKAYTKAEEQALLKVAHAAIEHGLKNQELELDYSQFSDKLKANAASFVTLEIKNSLRGCIGSLEAYRPLVLDVASNAFAAAFRDPRFLPVTWSELAKISLSISVLTQPVPIKFINEADLLRQLEPNVDGIILQERGLSATFLPTVWQALPQVEHFMAELKAKAGLPKNYWSETLRILRYTTILIKEA